MIGSIAALIAAGSVPRRSIFANVLAESIGLNNQKTQVKNVGTLTKNFLNCEGMRNDACVSDRGCAPGIRGNDPGMSSKLGWLLP